MMAESTEADRTTADDVARQILNGKLMQSAVRATVAQAIADERERALEEVLYWLSEDTDWAKSALSEDTALGIDHARRRVIEMRAGRWPSAANTAEETGQ